MAETVTIHTDGACRGNPGPGGWGTLIMEGGLLRLINKKLACRAADDRDVVVRARIP